MNAISDAEWDVRVALAAAHRLVHHFGWDDLVYTHITARLPTNQDHFLIKPFRLRFDEVTPASLVRIDAAGDKVDYASADAISPAGFVIHSVVHMARRDARCVLHTHSPHATLVSTLPGGFVPLTQSAFQFHDRIAYHDYEGIVLDAGEQRRIVDALDQRNVMLLRHHGTLILGRTVAEAFHRLYYLEKACKLQIEAMGAGTVQPPPAAVMERAAQQWESGVAWVGDNQLPMEWPGLLRLLDGKDPGWRSRTAH